MTDKSASDLFLIPEMAGLDARRSLVRIPPELDVPLTDRVRKIIDTPEFRRLGAVSQLGLVALVYPGARHTRFEHSLGVYRLALLFLKRLAHDERFAALLRGDEALLLIAAALLHDIGHWPYCHLIEDLSLEGVASHESMARRFIVEGRIAEILRDDWGVRPTDVLCLLECSAVEQRVGESDGEYRRREKVFHLLMSILSGPIDIDKMDYLFRDSHAAGVPYGRHFDQERLIGSLCLNAAGDGLAITDKGKTAAELMVFARYVMFSEVYWHHAVRAATVMFQRAFDLVLQTDADASDVIGSAFDLSPERWIDRLRSLCAEAAANPKFLANGSAADFVDAVKLLDGIFGPTRRIFKRVRQFSILEEPEIYRRLAGRPYHSLRRFADALTEKLNADRNFSNRLGRRLGRNEILLDAPPVGKEVELAIDVYYPNEKKYRPLNDVSPVVRALAKEQFDDYVKKVRLYADPDAAAALRSFSDLASIVADAAS